MQKDHLPCPKAGGKAQCVHCKTSCKAGDAITPCGSTHFKSISQVFNLNMFKMGGYKQSIEYNNTLVATPLNGIKMVLVQWISALILTP